MKNFPSFSEWLKASENSALGRQKIAMAFGTGVDLAPARLNSRATINPGLLDLINGKDSKYDKKSGEELDDKFGDKPDVDDDEYMKAPERHKKHPKGKSHDSKKK